MFVDSGLHPAAGIDVATDAVLGCVQGHQIHVRSFEKYVHGGVETAVDSGRIGHQTDPASLEQRESAVPQDLDANLHLDFGVGAYGAQQRRRANQVTKTVARQHIITIIKNPT